MGNSRHALCTVYVQLLPPSAPSTYQVGRRAADETFRLGDLSCFMQPISPSARQPMPERAGCHRPDRQAILPYWHVVLLWSWHCNPRGKPSPASKTDILRVCTTDHSTNHVQSWVSTSPDATDTICRAKTRGTARWLRHAGGRPFLRKQQEPCVDARLPRLEGPLHLHVEQARTDTSKGLQARR